MQKSNSSKDRWKVFYAIDTTTEQGAASFQKTLNDLENDNYSVTIIPIVTTTEDGLQTLIQMAARKRDNKRGKH
jgi:ABC-type polysaccharide/polyol phosphate export permease